MTAVQQNANEEIRPVKELLGLKRTNVNLDQLYLDPNNPRFGTGPLPEKRILEDGVQQGAQGKIEDIGISDLISSFRKYGFVPTDLIVVKSLYDDKYVVVEGNRRVAALRRLVSSHKKGDETLDQELLNSMTNLEVLVYEGSNADIAWIVQGLRHMSGIKEWPPLQQSMFIVKIEETIKRRTNRGRGRPPGLPTIARAAGVSVSRASSLLRSYYGFKQAKDDEEFGDRITNDKFSMFSEAIFKEDSLQNWLAWDNETRIFKNKQNLKKFLAWVTPPEDGGEPRIERALDARDVLPGIVSNSDLLRRFERGSIDIREASAELERMRPKPELDLDSLKQDLEGFRMVLDTLPLPKIEVEQQEGKFTELLESLKQRIEIQLRNLAR